MNDEEQALIRAGAQAAAQPFANLIEKLFGGACEELGGMWQDRLKVRRFQRQLKLFARVQSILEEAGIEPRQIPDNISIPLMNAALLEDDETLQERWAFMLANAGDKRQERPVSPVFPRILEELTSREAKFLDALLTTVQSGRVFGKTNHRNFEGFEALPAI